MQLAGLCPQSPSHQVGAQGSVLLMKVPRGPDQPASSAHEPSPSSDQRGLSRRAPRLPTPPDGLSSSLLTLMSVRGGPPLGGPEPAHPPQPWRVEPKGGGLLPLWGLSSGVLESGHHHQAPSRLLSRFPLPLGVSALLSSLRPCLLAPRLCLLPLGGRLLTCLSHPPRGVWVRGAGT